MKKNPQNVLIFLLILSIYFVFYWGFQDNYFFSDDFEWLSRAILAQDSTTESFRVVGRDFNPVFLILLQVVIRFFGLSPLVFRLLSLFTFSAVVFVFFHILSRHFKVNRVIALTAALLSGVNVFISEVVLNFSALVYSLSLLLLLVALKFYFDRKRGLYILFFFLAFLTKEIIVLAFIPLLFYEQEKRNRLFIIISTCAIGLFRILLQLGAAGSYTSFLGFSNFFYKLYFIFMRTMNISPYSIHPLLGAATILILLLIVIYYLVSKKIGRELLYFLLFLAIFSLFFSLLPKLSSRYFFYPSFGFWGMAALLAHYFYSSQQRNKKLKYALVPLLLISMLFNYPFIKREVEDYKILGDFSKQFILQQGKVIKNEMSGNTKAPETTLYVYKLNYRQLSEIYKRIKSRENLPKLLPFREHSVGGVIKPRHLIPIIFYPDKIVRWHRIKETPNYFKGYLISD